MAKELPLELPYGDKIIFYTREEARKRLLKDYHSPYFSRLTTLDMEVRMGKTLSDGYEKSLEEFKRFVQKQARNFTQKEKEAILEFLIQIYDSSLNSVPGFIPVKWQFIKTTGREETGEIYVREDCIVIPAGIADQIAGGHFPGKKFISRRKKFMVDFRDFILLKLCRATFMAATFDKPRLRDKLYNLIGFRKVIGNLYRGKLLEKKRLTNPDSPSLDYIIKVFDIDEKPRYLTPIFFSRYSHFSPDLGRSLKDYLRSGYAEVEKSDQLGNYQVKIYPNGVPVLQSPLSFPDFISQVRQNTDDLSCPAAIIGDNIGLLIFRKSWSKKYPDFKEKIDQDLLDEIQRVLVTGK